MKLSLPAAACLLLAARLGATDYCVHPSGNDLNPGSAAKPFKTALPLRKAKLGPGDRIFFFGGVTYTAGIRLSGQSGALGRPIIIRPYGKGRALIAPTDASESGILLENCSYVELRGLAFAGAGRDRSRADGISLVNTRSSACGHIVVESCEAWGFCPSGMSIDAKGRGGWEGVRVSSSSFHHNRDMGLHSSADWLQLPRPNKDITISNCKAYSNWGLQDSPNNMGGFVLMGVSGALMELSEAYDNGGDWPYGQGVFGFWCWSSDHVVMQRNESHHNRQNGKGSDGGGFDLDGAVSDSVVQYNYSHDNDGAGVLLAQFPKANESGPFRDNVVRYNISERDAQRGEYGAITVWGGSFQDAIGRCEIYNNTLYVSPATRGGKASAVRFMDVNYRDLSFMNNIFFVSGGCKLVDLPPGGDRATLSFKRNAYFSQGSPFRISWDGREYGSLASWTGAGAGKQEQENGKPLGIGADPMLAGPGQGRTLGRWDLLRSLKAYTLLPASPLRGQGLDPAQRLKLKPFSAVDYYGNPAPRGAGFEIGACEFPN